MQNQVTTSQLFNIFKNTEALNIPLIEQSEYLVDGDFKSWNGAFTEIKSAICKPTAQGKLEQIIIGKTP